MKPLPFLHPSFLSNTIPSYCESRVSPVDGAEAEMEGRAHLHNVGSVEWPSPRRPISCDHSRLLQLLPPYAHSRAAVTTPTVCPGSEMWSAWQPTRLLQLITFAYGPTEAL